jgi:chromosome segregation ATPase
MMRKQLETKFNKLIDMIEELESLKYEIDDKIEAINDKASNRDSGELTEREQEKIDALEERRYSIDEAIEYLEQGKDSIQEAIDSLDI